MAGSTITYPLNGADNWENFPDIVQKIQQGFMRLSITNMSNTNEPEIAAGSTCDVNGSCCVFSLDESITGWSGISNETDVWIKLTVSGSSVTASFTTSAPTWSDSKRGWYDGNDRYVGGLYKDSSGNYAIKWLYTPENTIQMLQQGNTRPILKKILEIGDWDMDASQTVLVTHGFASITKLRAIEVMIRHDNGTNVYPLDRFNKISDLIDGGLGSITSTLFELVRRAGGVFDSTGYDSTSFNRGWIHITYRA